MDTSFLNFLDLHNFQAGGSLHEIPLETGIKSAHHAIQQGSREFTHFDNTIRLSYSKNGKPRFVIPGVIPATAEIYAKEDSDSYFVVLRTGIKSETPVEEDGIEYQKTQVMSFTGNVKTGKGGDPLVYFFDPTQEVIQEERRKLIGQIADYLVERVGEGAERLLPQELLEELQ